MLRGRLLIREKYKDYNETNKKGMIIFMLKDLVKGVIIVSVAIPVSMIGMNVVGRLINIYSKNTDK